MSEMIDRIANDLRQLVAPEAPDEHVSFLMKPKDLVRFVVTRMREPTEAMQRAACLPDEWWEDKSALTVWESMVDEILK